MNNLTPEQLDRLISKLEINPENIYHIITKNGTEIIGEIMTPQVQITPEDGVLENEGELDSNGLELELELENPFDWEECEDKNILILNPIKILRDTWLDENGKMQHTNYYTQFNPCIEGPYTHLSNSSIQNINKPNKSTLQEYYYTIHEYYFHLLNAGIDGNPLIKESKKIQNVNVVDFLEYRKCKQSTKI